MSTIVRLFKTSAFEMLTAFETIVNVCIMYVDDIVKERPLWTEQYFNDFLTTIKSAYGKYLGIDVSKELRAATQALYSIINPATVDLSKCNTQIKADFDENKTQLNEYLNTLGFKDFYPGASAKNQEDLIMLVNQFTQNLTPRMEADFIAKGMSPNLISRIKDYTLTLAASNVTQETAKKIRPTLTDASIVSLNEIYTKGIKICKVVRGLYRGDKTKQDLFSFSKTVKAITSGTINTAANTPAVPTAAAK